MNLHSVHVQVRVAMALALGLVGPVCVGLTATSDEIFNDGFEGFDHIVCDSGLASDSSDPMQYAAAMDLCKTTTEQSTDWGLISANLSLSSGTGAPATASYAIRPGFGVNNLPRFGSSMVVLSTGAAAATGQINPSFVAFEPGYDTGTSSGVPADWLTAQGGTVPGMPGCPAASSTAYNPVMLTLRIRVPANANSFRLAANFFNSEYPEWVCSTFNDMFVVLLDSGFAGTPANPADKNLAIDTLGHALSESNTGIFAQCMNGNTGCFGLNPGTNNTCISTSGLTGTGMDTPDPGSCDANSLVGAGTDWLFIRGNVVPGEIMQLRVALWDAGDGTDDSVILLDNFQWSSNVVTPGASRN
jgi:hypothetical protein